LGASVLDKFLALGGSDEIHDFDSCLGGPQRSVHRTDGPRRVRPESNAAHRCQVREDRGSTSRDSGFALTRAVRSRALRVAATSEVPRGPAGARSNVLQPPEDEDDDIWPDFIAPDDDEDMAPEDDECL
jgi:hypothetical protein